MDTAIYARVSTNRQETENQLSELRKFCRKTGHRVVREYVDEASGGTSNRPQFKQLFRDAEQRKFDLVLFWALDRFSREGVRETLIHLERLTSAGVAWKSFMEQYLDSAGGFKDAIVGIMATLAKQERIKISERTIAGLATARARGKTLGRPKKRFDRERLIGLRQKGWSWSKLATEFRISRTQAARTYRERSLHAPVPPIKKRGRVTKRRQK